MNLKFKSSLPDLKFNIQSQFRILNQNVLYLTRETDDIKRMLHAYISSTKLQKQVDEYFDDESHQNTPLEDSKQDGTIDTN